eukprot:symbB.v1.2.002771.t2/scaffold141.1/size300911/22
MALDSDVEDASPTTASKEFEAAMGESGQKASCRPVHMQDMFAEDLRRAYAQSWRDFHASFGRNDVELGIKKPKWPMVSAAAVAAGAVLENISGIQRFSPDYLQQQLLRHFHASFGRNGPWSVPQRLQSKVLELVETLRRKSPCMRKYCSSASSHSSSDMLCGSSSFRARCQLSLQLLHQSGNMPPRPAPMDIDVEDGSPTTASKEFEAAMGESGKKAEDLRRAYPQSWRESDVELGIKRPMVSASAAAAANDLEKTSGSEGNDAEKSEGIASNEEEGNFFGEIQGWSVLMSIFRCACCCGPREK